MNSITFAFIITMIAGLSTLLGLIPIYIKFKNINKIICISLAFAAGVMLSVSINSLLEESISLLNKNLNIVKTIILVILFILIGILVSKLLDILFKKIDNKLYKLGITNAIALMIHNIPEGILTFSTTSINISLGLTLALSIMCHNIPEGISISVPIYYLTELIKNCGTNTCVIGSRYLKDSNIISKSGIIRKSISFFARILIKFRLNLGVSDTQCGFKIFYKDKSFNVDDLEVNTWLFDVELLMYLKAKGYEIKEIPVLWDNADNSRLIPKNAVIDSLKELKFIWKKFKGGKHV